MPSEESGYSSNLYYSFEVIAPHVVVLGSYTNYDENSDQYDWLQASFSTISHNITPWLLALFHVPWLNNNHAHQGASHKLMEAMDLLLYVASVDIVFAGHVHAYEPLKCVYNGKSD
ncbi:putative Acid phosphatase [Helianthus anomalus]